VSLWSASLHYGPDLVLHTASSGPIGALDELYLVVERNGEIAGFGEIRENIAYLTGLAPDAVRAGIVRLAEGLDWSAEADEIDHPFRMSRSAAPAKAAALIDVTLVDWRARREGIPACALFDVAFRENHPTNQSLFISEDRRFLSMAERYVTRGFTS